MKFTFPDFKKRTKQEIDDSVDKKDLTGGYTFFPWLLYMRTFYIVAIILNFFFGCKLWDAYKEYGYETVTFISAIVFTFCIPSFIVFLLFREYKRKKKGISQ
jgi:hypothetical protein